LIDYSIPDLSIEILKEPMLLFLVFFKDPLTPEVTIDAGVRTWLLNFFDAIYFIFLGLVSESEDRDRSLYFAVFLNLEAAAPVVT